MLDHQYKEIIRRLIRIEEKMTTLDADVQDATTVINDLVAALEAATNPVPAADQSALETAIAAGQAALTPPAPMTTDTAAGSTPPPPTS